MLRVLKKPELQGAIVLQELLQIMENLGLYDDDENNGDDQYDEDEDLARGDDGD